MAAHTLHDGSILKTINARELIGIPIWKGNRIIDRTHVIAIERDVGDDVAVLDHGYVIVRCTEYDAGNNPVSVSHIIDGQHRVEVLRRYFENVLCAPDFPVVVVEKHVKDEREIICYFNAINNTKPIQWRDVPMIVNQYVAEIQAAFNTRKVKYIREGRTCRPYLSVNLLRDSLTAHGDELSDSIVRIKDFVKRSMDYNTEKCRLADIEAVGLSRKNGDMLLKAASMDFILAVDDALAWIPKLLRAL